VYNKVQYCALLYWFCLALILWAHDILSESTVSAARLVTASAAGAVTVSVAVSANRGVTVQVVNGVSPLRVVLPLPCNDVCSQLEDIFDAPYLAAYLAADVTIVPELPVHFRSLDLTKMGCNVSINFHNRGGGLGEANVFRTIHGIVFFVQGDDKEALCPSSCH